jgi:hypothetical protein
MKTILFFPVATLLAVASVNAADHSFTRPENAEIFDDNPAGISSVIDVTGIEGWITNLTVSLNISGGWSGDYFVYVECNNGGYAVLLNRIGKTESDSFGSGHTGLNLDLNDQAAADVHSASGSGVLTGAWQPDGRETDPQNVFDTHPRTALLSSFNNRTPNGTWTLFVEDAAGGFTGTLVEWGLFIQSVPEPSSLTLALLGGGTLMFYKSRSRNLPPRP